MKCGWCNEDVNRLDLHTCPEHPDYKRTCPGGAPLETGCGESERSERVRDANADAPEGSSPAAGSDPFRSMEAHQERVIAEKADLDEKLAKLNEFGRGERFQALPEAEQERLKRQSKIMDDYSVVLGERIAAF